MKELVFVILLVTFISDFSEAKKKLPDFKLDEAASKELYQHWYDHAVSGLMTAVASQMLDRLPTKDRLQLEKCSQSASTIKKQAGCVVNGLNIDKVQKQMHTKKVIQLQARQSAFIQEPDFKQEIPSTSTRSPSSTTASTPPTTQSHTRSTRKPVETKNQQPVRTIISQPRVAIFSTSASLRKPHRSRASMSRLQQLNRYHSLLRRKYSSLGRINNQVSVKETTSRKPVRSRNAAARLQQLNQHQLLGRLRRRIKRMTTDEAIKRHLEMRKRLAASLQKQKQTRRKNKVSPGVELARMLTHAVRVAQNRTDEPQLSWKEVSKILKAQRLQKHRMEQSRANSKKLERYLKTLNGGLSSRRPLSSKFLDLPDEIPTISEKEIPKKNNRTLKSHKIVAQAARTMEIAKELVKLTQILTGTNQTVIKFMSPSILSIVPKQSSKEVREILSPDLFSFHEEGFASLPQLLDSVTQEERDAWMNFVLEASGSTKMLNKKLGIQKTTVEAMKQLPEVPPELLFTKDNATEMFGEATKTIIEVWERLYATYSDEQQDQLAEKGYAFLSRAQTDQLYGPNGPYNTNDTELLDALDDFDKLSDEEKEEALQGYIRQLSAAENFDVKLRDIYNTPIYVTPLIDAAALVSQHIVFSPLVLSPLIRSPSALGPVTLSPLVFSPSILSPRVLGPITLTPTVGSPLIVSPLALSPLTLSPGVMSPLIVSPRVLTPLTLSPQVMSPVIVSPFLLSPLVVNPWSMSPVIVSPFALSPLVLSPQDLFALVLSPRILSPLINSPLKRTAVVLSPDVLS